MGIYSYPLFARTSTGSPCDFQIPSQPAAAWEDTWFFNDREKTSWTLEEFMTPHPSACPKIYGYLDTAQKTRWHALCKSVLDAYPHLEWIQLHFYCSDEQLAFWFEYSKTTPRLQMFVGRQADPSYFKRRQRTWEEFRKGFSKEECETWEFDEALYRRAVVTATQHWLS